MKRVAPMGDQARLLNGWRRDRVQWIVRLNSWGPRRVGWRYDSRRAAQHVVASFPPNHPDRPSRITRLTRWTRRKPR